MKTPDSLLSLQQWFAKIITQPLTKTQTLPEISPFQTDIKKEAAKFVAPSKNFQPYQRLEIYHQQYWWRLLSTLQRNFPFVVRLFGYESFNHQIAVPYLCFYPPSNWALGKLGMNLPEWIKHSYFEEDKELVLQAAEIDAATLKAFSIKNLKPIPFKKMSEKEMLEKKLTLQPHLFLFHLPGNLFLARETFLEKEVEYWSNHPFPKIETQNGYFVLYRSPKNQVKWKELSFGEYKMLSYFKNGTSINEAIEKIEKEALEEATLKFPLWFREWTFLKWFGEV